MSTDFYKGWIVCSLGEVVTVQNGYAFPSKAFQSTGVPLIRQSNLDGNRISLERCVYLDPQWLAKKRDFVLQKNDLLIGMSGSVGKICVYDLDQPALQNQRTGKIVLCSSKFLDRWFVWEYLNTIEQQLLEKGKGMGVVNVSAADIESLMFPLAPLAEQHRIAAKLKIIQPKLDNCHRHITEISHLLKRFRRSLLSAACAGSLTADWRIQRKGSRTPNKTTAESGDLPPGWKAPRLDSIFEVKSGGTPSRKVKAYFKNGTIPWVKTGEVQNCDIRTSEEFITKEAVNHSNAKVFPSGTILIAMYGEGKTRGQIGRLLFPSATNQACAALVNPDLPPATNEYVFMSLLGQYYALRAESVGGNQPNLNLGVIKQWRINLPPLAEQEEIVRRVKNLLELADRIETRYRAAKQYVDRLPQSILAKAFRGELVPTEAELAEREGRSYESAEQLLQRIRAAKPETGSGGRNEKTNRRRHAR